MVVNGSQSPARTYLPFFERLASWGFIVVGTDDPQPGTGETAAAGTSDDQGLEDISSGFAGEKNQ